MPGLIRFNGVGSFDPHLPNRSIGKTFRCSGLTFAFGGNRLLLDGKASRSEVPNCYLVVVTSDLHGRINLPSNAWKSPSAAVIAASQLRNAQEAMLLMKVGDWVQTDCGVWQLMASEKAQALVALELIGDQVSA